MTQPLGSRRLAVREYRRVRAGSAKAAKDWQAREASPLHEGQGRVGRKADPSLSDRMFVDARYVCHAALAVAQSDSNKGWDGIRLSAQLLLRQARIKRE